MNIVAFDLGRHFAWATNWHPARPRWGHEVLGEVRAHRQAAFMAFLNRSRPWLSKVDCVVYETPFARGRDATRSLWGMAGVLEACASDMNLPVVDVAVSTIKAFAIKEAGLKALASEKGAAPKSKMTLAARRLGYTGYNDNEADAYCLLKYAEANLERT